MANSPEDLKAAVVQKQETEIAALEAKAMSAMAAEESGEAPAPSPATEADDPVPVKPLTGKEPSIEESPEALAPVAPAKPVDEPARPEPTTIETDDLEDEEVKQLSSRAQKRIQGMAKRIKDLTAINETLTRYQQPTTPQAPAPTPRTTLPWEEGGEVTPEDYERSVTTKAQEISQATVQHQLLTWQRLQNFNTDVAHVQKEYPELDDKSPQYDAQYTTKVGVWFTALLKTNPNLRLVDFVDELQAERNKTATKATSQVTAKIAVQAAEQALAPSGRKSGTEKKPTDKVKSAKTMSELEAMEAAINQQAIAP